MIKLIFAFVFLTVVHSSAIPPSEKCREHPNGLIADQTDSHKFWMCSNGQVVGHVIECPTVNGLQLQFDVEKQTCADKVLTHCDKDHKEGDTWAVPNETSRYFLCHNGKITNEKCYPDYLYYDVDQHMCMK